MRGYCSIVGIESRAVIIAPLHPTASCIAIDAVLNILGSIILPKGKSICSAALSIQLSIKARGVGILCDLKSCHTAPYHSMPIEKCVLISCLGVVEKLQDYYLRYVKDDNIMSVYNITAEHSFVCIVWWHQDCCARFYFVMYVKSDKYQLQLDSFNHIIHLSSQQ